MLTTGDDGRFSRFAALIGESQFTTLQQKHVVIFGIGGVGSYLAEALVRAGLTKLTLVDFDSVAPTNINRQLHAMSSTLARSKVAVMAERLRDINPHCWLQALPAKLTVENVGDFLAADVDYVADAIDDVPAKLALIEVCRERNLPLLCAMGTGNKLDPTRLQVTDISTTSVCPLCRKVRQQLHKRGIDGGIEVVFSTETPVKTCIEEDGRRVPASSPWLPSSAGLLMAAHIVRKLTE